jgi:hypothetical protein
VCLLFLSRASSGSGGLGFISSALLFVASKNYSYYPIRCSVKTVGHGRKKKPGETTCSAPALPDAGQCRLRTGTGTSLSRNSPPTSLLLQLLQPPVRLAPPTEYIYQAPSPPRRPNAALLPTAPARCFSSPASVPRRPATGNRRRRWRRRWGRCAAPEAGRTRPSGASIPKTLGEPCVCDYY